MEANARYTLVGLVVLVLTLGIVGTIVWLQSRGGSGDLDRYSIYFRHQSVDGLQVDSYATMRGIRVGNVASLRLSPDNIEDVRVVVRLDADTPVKQDTRAVIRRNLLTGLATIDLIGSTNESDLREEAPPGEPYPVIPEGASELDKVAASLPALLESATELVSRVSMFLNEDNQKAFSTSLRQLADVTKVLQENREDIGRVIAHTADAMEGLAKASNSINEFTEKSTHSVDAVARDIGAAIGEMGELARTLRQQSEASLASVEKSANLLTQQMYILSQGLVQASESAAVTLERLQNPRRALLGPRPEELGPGENLPLE